VGVTLRSAVAGAMQASAKISVVRTAEDARRFLSLWSLAAGHGIDELEIWLEAQPFDLSQLVAFGRYAAARPSSLAGQVGGLAETLYAADHFRPSWVVGPLSLVV
jgi:hypothetical protein